MDKNNILNGTNLDNFPYSHIIDWAAYIDKMDKKAEKDAKDEQKKHINKLVDQTFDLNKIIYNSYNDEELIEKVRKYNQSLPENQLNVSTINTDTQPQKEKTKKKCKVKCGCPCKKRIEDLEYQVDYLTDMVEFLMEDSEIFYTFMNRHIYKKRGK